MSNSDNSCSVPIDPSEERNVQDTSNTVSNGLMQPINSVSTEDNTKKVKNIYSCVKCPFSSAYPGNLRVHMRRHTGEKPFRCEFCSRPFSDKSNLNSHRRRKHTTGLSMYNSHSANSQQKRQRISLSKNTVKNRFYTLYNDSIIIDGSDYQNNQLSEDQSYNANSDDKLTDLSEPSTAYIPSNYISNDLPTMVYQPNAFNTSAKSMNDDSGSGFPKVLCVSSSRGEKATTSPYEISKEITNPIDYSQNDLFSLKQSFKSSLLYSDISSINMDGETDRDRSTTETEKNKSLNVLSHDISCQTDNEEHRTHECKHCGIIFRDFVMYTIHMGCHGCDNPFQCNVCGLDCGDCHKFACHFARGHHK